MKKLMFGLAATVAVGAFAIESANIVGYNQKTLTAGNLNQMAIPFTATGSDKATLADCIDIANATMAEEDKDADQIWIWNPATSGYENYYLYTDGVWYNMVTWETWETDFATGLQPGFSFWYSAKANANAMAMTQSGQVPDFATVPVAITKGNINAIAYPYPISFQADPDGEGNYAQVIWGNATAAEEDKDADQLWIWNPTTSGYENYYLYTDGVWYNMVTWDTFATDYPTGLPAGNFFWYSSKDDGNSQTITFKSPL